LEINKNKNMEIDKQKVQAELIALYKDLKENDSRRFTTEPSKAGYIEMKTKPVLVANGLRYKGWGWSHEGMLIVGDYNETQSRLHYLIGLDGVPKNWEWDIDWRLALNEGHNRIEPARVQDQA
jgi:hypothetical protein